MAWKRTTSSTETRQKWSIERHSDNQVDKRGTLDQKDPMCMNRDAGYQLKYMCDQMITRSRAPSCCKQSTRREQDVRRTSKRSQLVYRSQLCLLKNIVYRFALYLFAEGCNDIESNPFILAIIALSVVAGVVIIVAVILLILLLKRQAGNNRSYYFSSLDLYTKRVTNVHAAYFYCFKCLRPRRHM